MILTPEQQAILDGAKGDTMATVMKTMVMYGDAFEAEKLNLVIGHIPFPKKDKEKLENPIKLQVLKLLNKKYGINA